eukprot:7538548-Karenia_brevis.AAC.1
MDCGVPEGQEGFTWRIGGRACASEPSNREFAIQDLVGESYGQFGQRVHLVPSSPMGKGWMHKPAGGWMEPPNVGDGWGIPE